MQDKDVYKDPQYFERLQMYLFFEKGINIDNLSDFFSKYDSITSSVKEFEEQDPYGVAPPAIAFLWLWERGAIFESLKNSLYWRRRSYANTFASQYFFNEIECIRILQEIDMHAVMMNDYSIIAANPLIGILWYNDVTTFSTVFRRITSQDRLEYIPWEIKYWHVNKKRIDVNIYHPFVWYCLQTKQYDTLRLFSDPSTITHKKFLQFVNWLGDRQEKKRKYY